MKSSSLLLLALSSFVFYSCSGGRTPISTYQSSDIEQRTSDHHIIALLPFDASIQGKFSKNTTLKEVKNLEKEFAYAMQEDIYVTYLEKKELFSVEFQDIRKTDSLLKAYQIPAKEIRQYPMDALAKALHVDAIVFGQIVSFKPISEIQSYIHTYENSGFVQATYGSTGLVELTSGANDRLNNNLSMAASNLYLKIDLYEGKDGKILSRIEEKFSSNRYPKTNPTQKATGKLSKKMLKKLPYYTKSDLVNF